MERAASKIPRNVALILPVVALKYHRNKKKVKKKRQSNGWIMGLKVVRTRNQKLFIECKQ